MVSDSDYLTRYADSVMNTYGMPRRVLVRGSGAVVVDSEGREYLDLLAGIAVNALGHAHPRLVQRVSEQLRTLGHVSNFFTTPAQVELAERLLELATAAAAAPTSGRVFFTNSGSEANEAAFKLARMTGRPRVVAADAGFHGRTMGALALTGKPAIADPFRPLPGPVDHVPYGEVAALAEALAPDVAAVVLEPVQGEGGVVPAPSGYLAAARDLTRRHGALLVLDEVQTGAWRTGEFLAFQHPEALGSDMPDVVTMAKGLGGGIPVGACLAFGETADLLGPGRHGSTFGGNPIAAAAALAVLDAVVDEGLADNVTVVSERFSSGVSAMKHPMIDEIRGAGLLLGIGLTEPLADAVAMAALDAGFIVNPVRPDTIRLAPPLILTLAQANHFLAELPGILDHVVEQTEVRR